MSRSTEEWIGKTDDTSIPPRVRIRVFDKYKGICQCGCGIKISAGDKWDADHIVAIINGGENRESNLHPLIHKHHVDKTKEDVAEKSETYKMKKSYLGIKKKSRFPCSKDSKFKRKITGEVVLRK